MGGKRSIHATAAIDIRNGTESLFDRGKDMHSTSCSNVKDKTYSLRVKTTELGRDFNMYLYVFRGPRTGCMYSGNGNISKKS